MAPSITSIATSTMPPPSQPPSSASAYYPGAGSSITSPTFVPASGLAQRESDGGPLPVRVDGEEANLRRSMVKYLHDKLTTNVNEVQPSVNLSSYRCG